MSPVLVPMIRTFDASEFDASTLVRQKGDQRISVCLPARNEAETVGAIVDVLRRELVERVQLVDELLVIDDHSTDRTAAVGARGGCRGRAGGRHPSPLWREPR